MMSKKSILRYLSLLSFLLFFCPFFQMCSDESLSKYSFKSLPTENVVEVEATHNIDNHKVSQRIETVKANNTFEEDRKRVTLNAYQLASRVFEEKITLDNIKDLGFLAFFSYSVVILTSLIIVISSFSAKYKTILYLSVLNLLLAIGTAILFILDSSFDEITQIKFGYYLFIANCIAIILFAKNLKNQTPISKRL